MNSCTSQASFPARAESPIEHSPDAAHPAANSIAQAAGQGRASSTQAPGEHTRAGLLPELTVKNPEGNIARCIPAALPFTFPLGITWHNQLLTADWGTWAASTASV